jgi:hypothetical protein
VSGSGKGLVENRESSQAIVRAVNENFGLNADVLCNSPVFVLTGKPEGASIAISMDRQACSVENIFVEQLWRSP